MTTIDQDQVNRIAADISAMLREPVESRTLHEAGQRLAALFGERYGWKLSKSDFAFADLSRKLDDEYSQSAWWWNRAGSYTIATVDHPYYYREIERPYRPAAIAAHLYNPSLARIAQLADQLDIAFEMIDDFPSWHYPNRTKLVLYRRKAEGQ